MKVEDQIYYSCAAWSMIMPNRAAVLNHLFCVIGNGYEWENGELVECCGDTTTKNGRRLSLKAAINQVFRNRRKSAEFRKEWERNRKREEKLALKHTKGCALRPTRAGHSGPVSCTCGAQARIDANKAQNAQIDALIDKCLEEMKSRPPQSDEEKIAHRKQLAAESKKIKAEIRESEKYEYRAPADIDERVRDTKYNYWYPMCEYSRMVTFPDDIKDEWLAAIIETCKLVIANPRGIDSNNPAERIAETTAIAQKCLERAQNLSRARAHEVLDGK